MNLICCCSPRRLSISLSHSLWPQKMEYEKLDIANFEKKKITKNDHRQRPTNGYCHSTERSIHNQVWCLMNLNWYFVDASVAVAVGASFPLISPLNCRHCYCLPFDDSAIVVVDVDFVYVHDPLYLIHLRRLLCTLDYLMMSRLPYFQDYLIARTAMKERRSKQTHTRTVFKLVESRFISSPLSVEEHFALDELSNTQQQTIKPRIKIYRKKDREKKMNERMAAASGTDLHARIKWTKLFIWSYLIEQKLVNWFLI